MSILVTMQEKRIVHLKFTSNIDMNFGTFGKRYLRIFKLAYFIDLFKLQGYINTNVH